ELPEDDLIRIGGNVEVDVEQNQVKGKESLAALKSLFG
ncbi:MAG: ATP-dependent DNA helicase Rep, partial [Neolewinella sp.]